MHQGRSVERSVVIGAFPDTAPVRYAGLFVRLLVLSTVIVHLRFEPADWFPVFPDQLKRHGSPVVSPLGCLSVLDRRSQKIPCKRKTHLVRIGGNNFIDSLFRRISRQSPDGRERVSLFSKSLILPCRCKPERSSSGFRT